MIFGILAACIHGSMMPLMTIVFGDLTSTFINNDQFDEDFWNVYGANVTELCNLTKEEAQADSAALL